MTRYTFTSSTATMIVDAGQGYVYCRLTGAPTEVEDDLFEKVLLLQIARKSKELLKLLRASSLFTELPAQENLMD